MNLETKSNFRKASNEEILAVQLINAREKIVELTKKVSQQNEIILKLNNIVDQIESENLKKENELYINSYGLKSDSKYLKREDGWWLELPDNANVS